MQIACCFLFLGAVVQLCIGQDINCTVTQEAGNTLYTVSEVSRIADVKPNDCEYFWTANYVIANHKQKDPKLVVTNTINAIVTAKCFDIVIFTRSCISEGGSYTAHCAINCTLNAQKDKEFSHIWIGLFVGASIFLVLLFCVLCYIFKDKCFEMMRTRPSYKSVMMPNVPKGADVETGN